MYPAAMHTWINKTIVDNAAFQIYLTIFRCQVNVDCIQQRQDSSVKSVTRDAEMQRDG